MVACPWWCSARRFVFWNLLFSINRKSMRQGSSRNVVVCIVIYYICGPAVKAIFMNKKLCVRASGGVSWKLEREAWCQSRARVL